MTVYNLFKEYNELKSKEVDNPNYEPLGQEVIDEEKLKKMKIKEYNRRYYDKNKEKFKEYQQNRRKRKVELKLKESEEALAHRDTLLSNMYDMIRNDLLSAEEKINIIKIVVNEAVGEEITLTENIIVNMYYKGLFR